MPIIYNRLFELLEKKGISMYQIRMKSKVIGGATWDKLTGKSEGHIDTRSIERLCAYLNCQPGDIMEYVPDEQKGDFENENEIKRD